MRSITENYVQSYLFVFVFRKMNDYLKVYVNRKSNHLMTAKMKMKMFVLFSEIFWYFFNKYNEFWILFLFIVSFFNLGFMGRKTTYLHSWGTASKVYFCLLTPSVFKTFSWVSYQFNIFEILYFLLNHECDYSKKTYV